MAAIKKIITSKENNFAFGGDLKDEDIFEFLNIIHKAKNSLTKIILIFILYICLIQIEH